MMHNTVRAFVIWVISEIKYERLKLEGEYVRAVFSFRSIVEKSEWKGREKREKKKRRRGWAWKPNSPAARYYAFRFFLLANFIKEICTAAFRIAFPFTEISETHRFLWRNSTLRVFHEEAGIETFLLSLPWLERARHTHSLSLSLTLSL